MKYFATLVTAVVAASCSDATLDCSLVKSDKSIRIPINSDANSTTYNLRHVEQNGIEYLAVENMTSATISIYNLTDCTHYKDVIPQVQGPNGLGGKMVGFDMIGLDTIVIANGSVGNRLGVINSDAMLIKNIEFDISARPFFPLSSCLYSNLGYAISCRDSRLFVSADCLDVDDAFYNMHTQSVGYCYDFVKEEAYRDTMHLPNISRDRSGVLNGLMSMIVNGGKRVLSFLKGHYIYVRDGSEWKRYNVRSSMMTKPLKKTQPSTIENVKIQFVENPHYRAMIYDKYRDVYYRIVYLGYDFKQGDDQFKLSDFLPRFSVMILDHEFNVIGETMMPEKMYNIHMFFVNKDGLWFSTNNIDNPSFEEDAINFDLFVLKR